jgi:hypothetical protein
VAWARQHALVCPRCGSDDWLVEWTVGRILCKCFGCGTRFGADDALRVMRARRALAVAA